MKILVISCDKFVDTFMPFRHCMEKYWPDHPEVFYATESVINPYYNTLCYDIDLSRWTERIKKSVEQIDDEYILMLDSDVFIREKVNADRINYIESVAKELPDFCNITFISEVRNRPDLIIQSLEGYTNIGIKIRDPYDNTVNCTLWKKDMLLKCLEGEPRNVWQFENNSRYFNGKYYASINADWPIKWGREKGKLRIGLIKGHWAQECVDFLKSEGLDIDFNSMGVVAGE